MKKITELNEQEILALNDADLQLMVKHEMAEQGIKILSIPESPIYEELPAKELKLFKVSGVDHFFVNEDDAKIVSEALRSVVTKMGTSSYIGSSYDHQYIEPYSENNYSFNSTGNINPVMFYKKETLITISDVLKTNKTLKNQYEEAMVEYNDCEDKAGIIREDIYGKYYEVVKKYRDFETMKMRYDEYLSLADGNEKTAMKFLKNAYSVDAETERYIKYGGVENEVSETIAI